MPKQCNIGYLTLVEALRYCTVGNYLKNPRCEAAVRDCFSLLFY